MVIKEEVSTKNVLILKYCSVYLLVLMLLKINYIYIYYNFKMTKHEKILNSLELYVILEDICPVFVNDTYCWTQA